MTKALWSPRRFGAWLFCAGVATAVAVVVVSNPGCDSGKKPAPSAAPPKVAREPKPISVDFVPKEALFALAIDPDRTMNRSKLKMSELEEFKTLLNADTGIDLGQIDQVLVVGGLGSGLSPFYGAILRYKASAPRQQVLQTISPAWEEISAGEKKYQKPKEGEGPCICFADDKTLVVAPEATLKTMLNVPADADSLVLQRLRKLDDSSTMTAVVDVKRLNGVVALATATSGGLPAPFDKPPLSNLRELLKYFNDAVVKVEVAPDVEIAATLYAADEEKAKAGNTLIEDTLTGVGKMLDEQEEGGAVQSELAEVMTAQFNGIVRDLVRTQQDNTVTLKFGGKVLENDLNLIAPAAVAPYIKSWRETLKAQSATNLARVAAALDAYAAAKGSYPPPASLSADGKPLLSWRVALLPILGEQALYDEFHLDEPWDSAHNKPLVGRIPAVYRFPRLPATGKTQLLLPTGPSTIFAGTDGPKPDIITDDKAKTILLFEVENSKGVEWTKPADLVLDKDNPLKGLQGYIFLPLNVVFANGSVGKFDFEKDGPDLRSLLSPAGGDSDARPAPPAKAEAKPADGDKNAKDSASP